MKKSSLTIFVLFINILILQTQQKQFPLKRVAGQRYLVTQNNKPYLINAATCWLIYLQLTTEEAREYFLLRKAQGFNTILTMTAYNPKKDINRYGQRPFGNSDFNKPNEAYFSHVYDIIKMADSLDLLIVMSQPWQGCCHEGYGLDAANPLQQNGQQKSNHLGKYFGKKFNALNNLIWVMGGDQDPLGDRLSIEAMAKGIYETAPHQLITYHGKPTHSSTDLYQYAPWLNISMIYTYWRDKPDVPAYPQMLEVYEMALREYMKTDTIPFFLGESQYEGFDGNGAGTPYMVRRQAYWTILCGGMGVAYGDDAWDSPANWREVVKNYPGANQLKYFYDFFSAIEWWRLIPDYTHQIVTKGYGELSKTNYVTAAMSNDSSFFVAYIPYQQTLTVDLSKFKSRKTLVQWYNTRTGEYTLSGHYRNIEHIYFSPPDDEDWVLYIKTE